MFRYLDRLGEKLAACARALSAIALLIMVASLLLGVFYRYVLGSSLSWSDEVALLAFTWAIFLFASALVRECAHARVTLVFTLLPGILVELLERLSMLLIILFGAVMLFAGWDFASLTARQVSPAIRYPLWLHNIAIPVSGALIIFHATVLLLRPSPLRELKEPSHG